VLRIGSLGVRALGPSSLAVIVFGGCASKHGGLPAASCTSGDAVSATEPDSVDSISENVDTTCAAVATYLPWKMGAVGSACTDPIDCSPVCCPCPNGTHYTAATWCNDGLCAEPTAVACMVLVTGSLGGCSLPGEGTVITVGSE
jgi:hypothetical protein